MQTITSRAELQSILKEVTGNGNTVGLAPTMGNLHAGHIELVKRAKANTDCVVSSIFVNPLQFGANEDLDSYPRTLEEDQRLLTEVDCDFLYAPSIEDVYGADVGDQSIIHVPKLSADFCGKFRPGHFDGVATVVCKLLNIVRPNKAYFGLKDYQQFLIIQKMALDLAMPVDIIGVETQRAASGLALSSRNNYLSEAQKTTAALLYQCLCSTAEEIKQGSSLFAELESAAKLRLQNGGIEAEYFTICNADNLQAATPNDTHFAILAAGHIGPSRLIDNIRFKLDA